MSTTVLARPTLVGAQCCAGDVRHCLADITRAKTELGFEPQVQLERGIPELIEAVRDQSPEDHVERATQALVRRGLAR